MTLKDVSGKNIFGFENRDAITPEVIKELLRFELDDPVKALNEVLKPLLPKLGVDNKYKNPTPTRGEIDKASPILNAFNVISEVGYANVVNLLEDSLKKPELLKNILSLNNKKGENIFGLKKQ